MAGFFGYLSYFYSFFYLRAFSFQTFSYLCKPKALLWSAAGASERKGERKVRAAQGTPLLKVEAVGDGWSGEKKTTANLLKIGKGEKVV